MIKKQEQQQSHLVIKPFQTKLWSEEPLLHMQNISSDYERIEINAIIVRSPVRFQSTCHNDYDLNIYIYIYIYIYTYILYVLLIFLHTSMMLYTANYDNLKYI